MSSASHLSALPSSIPQAAFDDLWNTTDRLIAESRERRGGFSVAALIGACVMPHDGSLAESFLRARADLLPSAEPAGLLFKAGW